MRRATKWILGSALGLGVAFFAIVVLVAISFFSARRAVALYEKGQAALERGDEAQALASFDAALEKHLTQDLRARVLLERAQGRKALGDSYGALRDYNEAIRLNPQSAATYAWRGVFFDGKGNVAAATADYSRALELDPNLGGVLSRRGRFYLDQNKLVEAPSARSRMRR